MAVQADMKFQGGRQGLAALEQTTPALRFEEVCVVRPASGWEFEYDGWNFDTAL